MGYGVAMPTQCYTHLRIEDRETLSREYARNLIRGRPYRACTAQTQAATRACQLLRLRTRLDPWLWPYARIHLGQGGAPEQIAGRRRRADPPDKGKPLSAETN